MPVAWVQGAMLSSGSKMQPGDHRGRGLEVFPASLTCNLLPRGEKQRIEIGKGKFRVPPEGDEKKHL